MQKNSAEHISKEYGLELNPELRLSTCLGKRSNNMEALDVAIVSRNAHAKAKHKFGIMEPMLLLLILTSVLYQQACPEAK